MAIIAHIEGEIWGANPYRDHIVLDCNSAEDETKVREAFEEMSERGYNVFVYHEDTQSPEGSSTRFGKPFVFHNCGIKPFVPVDVSAQFV